MDGSAAQSYVGRKLTEVGEISTQRCAEICATFGWDDDVALGGVLPQLAHWCAFSPVVATEKLGSDGHPAKGAFLPDLGLERRMWASGSLQFLKALHVGERLERRMTIEKVDIKEGSTGTMAFVTVDHDVLGEDGLAIKETQNIVYLAMPKSFNPPPKKPMLETFVFEKTHPMPSTRLFRFSAITFNAHRIHFDLPYAQDVEQYPGLVVHGPMQAMIIARETSLHAKKPLTHFDFRGVHPCFHFDDFTVRAEQGDETNQLSIAGGVLGGHRTMQAKARW